MARRIAAAALAVVLAAAPSWGAALKFTRVSGKTNASAAAGAAAHSKALGLGRTALPSVTLTHFQNGLSLPTLKDAGENEVSAAPSAFAVPSALSAPSETVEDSGIPDFQGRALSEDELLAVAMGTVLDENPAVREHALRGFEGAFFRPLLGAEIDSARRLSESIARAFKPVFVRAAEDAGVGLEAYLHDFLSEGARESREGFARVLGGQTSARSEQWTYLFRDSGLWEREFRDYLSSRIREKRGSKELLVHSVGAAYGAEPYSIAIAVEEELKKAGENPAAWGVRIRAFDISLHSLIAMQEGLYREPRNTGYKVPDSTFRRLERESANGHFEATALPEVHAIRPELAAWIEPVYLDLNDVRVHSIITSERPDAVFANYVLTHLRRVPASALAEHWLSGNWSDHGFLSMAQTVVAEVFADADAAVRGNPIGRSMPFLRRFALTVGAIGGSFYSDSFSPRPRWRDRLFRHKSKVGKDVLSGSGAFMKGLRGDPFYAQKVSVDMLALIAKLSKDSGYRAVLTDGDALLAKSEEPGTLQLSIGWLLEGETDAPVRAALLRKMWSDLTEDKALPEREPAPLSGPSLDGAILKVVEGEQGPVLRWLASGKLSPITDEYIDETPPAPQSSGVKIRF